MAIRSILTTEADFKGHVPVTEKTSAMWRFDEAAPDAEFRLLDASSHGRHLSVSGWTGTTASMIDGWQGRYIRINRNNPATEKTYLKAINDGSFFAGMGAKIAAGGWIYPLNHAVTTQYSPILNIRQGPGQPLFYISLISGSPA